jgi:hypothetical protein
LIADGNAILIKNKRGVNWGETSDEVVFSKFSYEKFINVTPTVSAMQIKLHHSD